MARPTLEPQTELARRLCAVRQALDFKERKQFATHLGIHEKTLGNYETGKHEPTASVLAIYNAICGVSPIWLLTGEGEMFSDPTLAARTAPPVVPVVMELLYKMVEKTAKEYNYKLSPAQISHDAAELYNELVARVTDITDMEEVELIILQLRYFYTKRSTRSAQQNNRSNVA